MNQPAECRLGTTLGTDANLPSMPAAKDPPYVGDAPTSSGEADPQSATRATEGAVPSRPSYADFQPSTDRLASAAPRSDPGLGGFTNTGTRRPTRINGSLTANTQRLDTKLQMSRISVFADMASRAGSQLTGKLSRMVETHGTHGRYVVQRPLASGGMGAVLEIKDGDFQRRAAMKIILPRYAKSADTLERFLAEAQITAQLEHPNIVPIHDLGVMDDGTLYFTMKFVEGQSLGGVLKRLKSEDAAVRAEAQAIWTTEHILLTFLKVLDGVGFANSRGVVHRDLKPDNIMLGDHGEVLVVDWGIAKIVGQADPAQPAVPQVVTVRDYDNTSATMAGNAIGTIYYMPPEQADGRLDDIDARSDVYALGATLYELLTLKRPVRHEALLKMVEQIAAGRIIPVLTARPDLPLDLAAIVTRAMATARRDRYQTCDAFAEDIRRFLAGQAVVARQRNRIERLGAWVQRHRKQALMGAGAVALAILTVIGTTLQLGRQARAEAAALRGQAQALVATATAPVFSGLDQAHELITASLAKDAANEDALLLKAEILARRNEQDRLRGEVEKQQQAEVLFTKARGDFATALGSFTAVLSDAAPDQGEALATRLAAIDADLAAAWKLARLDSVAELRTQVAVRRTQLADHLTRLLAVRDLHTCDRILAEATRRPSDDVGLDALVDQAVALLQKVQATPFPPAGLAGTTLTLDRLREKIAAERQAATDRAEAVAQTAKAQAALDAHHLDEALAAIGAALSRQPRDAGIDDLRQRILQAQRSAQAQAEQAAQAVATRARAGAALNMARQAEKSMQDAAQRSAALEPRIAELERSGRDRPALVACQTERNQAQQQVAEQWALVEQHAATVVTALDGDRDYTASDGTKPWSTARRLLADLYWDRLAAAQRQRALPEIAAFTNLLKRFDDGHYGQRLSGAGTLSLHGNGRVTLTPLGLKDGRLVADGAGETLSLPLAARSHPSGRFALQAGALACAVYLPPNGTLAITLPALLPAVPGHDCRVVLAADGGKSFLLGTHEITQAQYHAFITSAAVWPQVQKSWRVAVEDPSQAMLLLPRQAHTPHSATWQWQEGASPDQLAAITLPAGLAELPVTGISRDDAEAYCAWLAQRTGLSIRLPMRREWQLAANGGDPLRIHPWGEHFDRTFPVCAMSLPADAAHPLKPGSHPADTGPFGHWDLGGNVREWLADRAAPGSDLTIWHGAIIAGGGYFDTNPDTFRSTYSESLAPDTPHGQIGFRVLVELP